MSGASATLLLLLLLLPVSRSEETSIFNAAFSSFNDSDLTTSLIKLGDAETGGGALQLTQDLFPNANSYLVNNSGRVLLRRPFKIWDEVPHPLNDTIPRTTNTSSSNATTTRIASFNTSFTVNIYPINAVTPGEGFAFLIAPSLDDPPPNSSYGGYLGLTNKTLDGRPSNHFVAIEFDTVKQWYDPDNNHIGLDINSVVSNVTTSLTPRNITIATQQHNHTVWIQYDGAARHVWVYMALEGQPKPIAAALEAPLDLSAHLLQWSYFGFAGSTGTDYELNCVLAWNLTVELLPEKGHGMAAWKLALVIGLPSAAVVLILGILIGSYVKRRKVGADPSALAGTLKSLPGMPREFKFKELKQATNNFNDEHNKLGQGGFGTVYKGVLPEEHREVAVKKFSRDNIKGQEDFLAELSIINRLRHKHLVPLVGWCHKNGVLLLVYDFMPNGSLDKHLFCGPDKPPLTWDRRCNILTGVASALHYLHNEYDQKVVHRDLKASNVMLDASFNARLGDFGLARALDTDKTSYAELMGGVPGTFGYLAPECLHTGKFTRESDVFGFGAVVLEVVCGRRPSCNIEGFKCLTDWVWKLYREGRILDAVDPRLNDDYVNEEAERLLLLGLACSHPMPGERPKTQAILQIISGSVPPPQVPPFRPPFVWPSSGADGDEGDGGAATSSSSRVTSAAVTSSYYASSSAAWTPGYVSRDADVGGSDVSMV